MKLLFNYNKGIMAKIEVKTNVNHPFDWMEAEEWMWMAEMTNSSSYTYADDLYRVIDGTITEGDFEHSWGKVKDFKEEYRKCFPELLASCLENLADSIRKGEIVLDIDFNI